MQRSRWHLMLDTVRFFLKKWNSLTQQRKLGLYYIINTLTQILLIGLSKERPILDHHAKTHIHEIRRVSPLNGLYFHGWNPGEIRRISKDQLPGMVSPMFETFLCFWLIWHNCQRTHAVMNFPMCVVWHRWHQYLWIVLPTGLIIENSYFVCPNCVYMKY